MTTRIILLIIVLCQYTCFSQSITVRGQVITANGDLLNEYHVQLYFNGAKKPIDILNISSDHDTICKTFLTGRKFENVRIQISKKGFTTRSKNIPTLKWDNNNSDIILGSFYLDPIDNPISISIVPGVTPTSKEYLFHFQVTNKTGRSVNVKEININATGEYRTKEACFDPLIDIPTYIVDDQIYLVTDTNKKSNRKIISSYRKPTDSIKYNINGEMGYNRCTQSKYIRLKLPCSLVIPTGDSEFKIFLPMKFKYHAINNQNIDLLTSLSTFKELEFKLTPKLVSDISLDISGTYTILH